MRWRATVALLAMALMATCSLLPATEHAAAVEFSEWQTETVESTYAGLSADIAVGSDDTLHVVYPYKRPVCVRYAFSVEGRWTKQYLQTETGEVRHVSIALDSRNTPHILYTVLKDGKSSLKHATYDGIKWTYNNIEPGASLGEEADIAIDTHNVPHVAYTNSTNSDLKYAKWTGSAFFPETIDAGATVVARPTLDTDSQDRAHIAYYDDGGQKLKEAFNDLGRWILRTIDTGASNGYMSSIAVDDEDNAHVSYIKAPGLSLSYAVWTGTEFIKQTVEGSDDSGFSNNLGLAPDGTPHIVYRTDDPAKVKHAQYIGGQWERHVVDENPTGVGYVSFALNRTAYPQVVYAFSSGEVIKHAQPYPNQDPLRPEPPSGPVTGSRYEDYAYIATANDPDADPVKLVFDWGNGETSESPLGLSGQSVTLSHNWTVSGTFNVRARAVDSEGGSSPWSDPLVVVINAPPHAPVEAVGPATGEVGLEHGFDFVAVDPDADMVRLRIDWDEPQGTPSSIAFTETVIKPSGTVVNVPHTWTKPGTYEVRYLGIDVWEAESNWSAPHTIVITRAPSRPATPSGPQLLLVSEEATFTANSTDPDGDQVRYIFEIGPPTSQGAGLNDTGLMASGSTATLRYNWSSGGVRTIRVRAIDQNNITSDWSPTLEVRVNTRPDVPHAPNGPKRLLEKEEGSFNTFTGDDDGDKVRFIFDWGDGNVTTGGPLETELLPVTSAGVLKHKWAKPGTYFVTVKAVDEYGAESDGWSESFTVNVHEDVTWWEANGIYVYILVAIIVVIAVVLVAYMRGGQKEQEVDIAKLIELEEQKRSGGGAGGGGGGTGGGEGGYQRPLP